MPVDPPPGFRIMIVDEFALMRKLLRDMLAVLGHRDVTEAASGEEALVALLATGAALEG